MKTNNQAVSLNIIMTILFLFTGCEGELISELKDFEKNTPPQIVSFNSDIAEDEEILPNMQVNLSVEALDEENDNITYTFSSDYGTFRRQQDREGGCNIEFFISSECPTSESIPITVTATDSKGGSSVSILDIGDGRSAPNITVTWPETTLTNGQTVNVSFVADSSGFYQTRIGNSEFDQASASHFYNRGETASFIIKAGTGGGVDVELTPSGTYTVYIILIDNFQRQVFRSEDFTY